MQRKILLKNFGPAVIGYISQFLDIEDNNTVFIQTSTRFNIDAIEHENLHNLVNLKRINGIRFLNKFFEAVNKKLPVDGVFIGYAETIRERRKRILGKFHPIFSYPYYTLDFIVKRVFPKMSVTRKIYFFLTRGSNRVLSLTEILGRLVSCGFEIVDFREIDNNTYFTVRKVSEPVYDMQPSYGPLFKMRRVGKGGKPIVVYKVRTMHAYSEYLQKFVYERNKLAEGGKLKDDFRVTNWGKFLRKFWLDELPMILNVFRGELKIVGVRPLSEHYLSLYNEKLREKRLKTKPGLIPPFYVDLPKSLEEIMASEEKYLDAYSKSPFLTDLKYFFKAFFNIAFKKARSG